MEVITEVFSSGLNLCFLQVVPDRDHSESVENEDMPVRSYSRLFFFTFGFFRSPVGSIVEVSELEILTFVFFHENFPFLFDTIFASIKDRVAVVATFFSAFHYAGQKDGISTR